MNLDQLLTKTSIRISGANGSKEIKRITDDSRLAGPGVIFCATEIAIPHIQKARDAGAIVITESPAQALGELSASYFDFPSTKVELIGVTGTNGKTSTAWMIYHLWKAQSIPCGLIGTLGVRYVSGVGTPETVFKTGYTTPRPFELQELLHTMQIAGVKKVVMEVSSEAVALGRTIGLTFSKAIFTNLTRDHLDYHKTMENYFDAKARFIQTAAEQGASILLFQLNPNQFEQKMISFAKKRAPDSTRIISAALDLGMPGFQNINGTLAIESIADSETEKKKLIELARSLPQVPGRFESIPLIGAKNSKSFAAVDYAHTPDALLALLSEVKRLGAHAITIFGCGGDRDPGKRPIMGKIAAENSMIAIITDDNPRTEAPDKIRSQIREGIPASLLSRVIEVGDRRLAIKRGIDEAQKNSEFCIVVVAGKGHETDQILSDRKEHFSDVEEVMKIVSTS